jgi:hypothetical protein
MRDPVNTYIWREPKIIIYWLMLTCRIITNKSINNFIGASSIEIITDFWLLLAGGKISMKIRCFSKTNLLMLKDLTIFENY